MKHIKGKILVLMGFLLVVLPAHGVKQAEKPTSQLNQYEFRINVEERNISELKNILNNVNQYTKNILLNSRYGFSEVGGSIYPLNYAIEKQDINLANYLIEQGANVNVLNPTQSLWLLLNQPIFVDGTWIISRINDKDFASNLILNLVINPDISKNDKLMFVVTLLSGYESQLDEWFINELYSLKIILEDKNYGNVMGINSPIEPYENKSLFSVALEKGFTQLGYYLVLLGADVNNKTARTRPILLLISYLINNPAISDQDFTNYIRFIQFLIRQGTDVVLKGFIPKMGELDARMLIKVNELKSKYISDMFMTKRLQRMWNAIDNPNDPNV